MDDPPPRSAWLSWLELSIGDWHFAAPGRPETSRQKAQRGHVGLRGGAATFPSGVMSPKGISAKKVAGRWVGEKFGEKWFRNI